MEKQLKQSNFYWTHRHEIGCFGLFLLAFYLSVSIGSSGFGLGSLADLYNPSSDLTGSLILLKIRIPRLFVAALCGAALGSSGVISQGLFRNPLASPSILGTTSGGALAAALTFFFGIAEAHWLVTPVAGLLGSFLATAFVFYLSRKSEFFTIANLMLIGFALNAFLGSLTSLIISLSMDDYQKTAALLHWLFGGFSARSWEHFFIGIGPIAIGIVWSYWIAARLDVLSLGEEVASTLQSNIRRLRGESIVAMSLLVGVSVSIAGGLPFVGRVVPHISRYLVGPHHKKLVLYSALNGMTLTLIADLIARTVRAPLEFEVGILTSLLGAPFFVYLLMQGERR